MKYFYAITGPAVILVLWQVIAWLQILPAYLLPKPDAVFHTFIDMAVSGTLTVNIQASLQRVFEGFFISAICGCLMAWFLTNLPVLQKLLEPVLDFLRMTPPLATIPLLILWFGIGETTQLAIIIMAAFFPVFLNAMAGLARLDDKLKELSHTLELSKFDFIIYFALPAAFPSIITGLRLGFGYSWRALIAAELIAASSGLGYMIQEAEQMQRIDIVITGIFCIGFIGWGFDFIFRKIIAIFFACRFPELKF